MSGLLVHSPLRVKQSAKKDFILNLNVFRNTHFRTLNTVKIRYKEMVTPQILLLPKLGRIRLVYTLYPATRRLCDVANVCSIHSKFFEDALVELGIIEDDNYKFLDKVEYVMGEVDKENPRVDILIIPQ